MVVRVRYTPWPIPLLKMAEFACPECPWGMEGMIAFVLRLIMQML